MVSPPQTPNAPDWGTDEPTGAKKDTDPMTITIKTTPEGADTLTDALTTYAEHFPEFAATVAAILAQLIGEGGGNS